jgi:hypothetical protein
MASIDTNQLLANLNNSGLSTSNPVMYDTIKKLILNVDNLSKDITSTRMLVTGGVAAAPPQDIIGFTYNLTNLNIILSWTSLGAGYSYEIRRGTVWTTASYVTTTLGNAVPLDPLSVGSYNYLIKAISGLGIYSTNASALTVVIPAIGHITVTAQVVDNYILFSWSAPSSAFKIDTYSIYKGNTLLGSVAATFFTYFEMAGGTNDYSIIATDIAGNESPDETSITVTVSAPVDFANQGSVTDSAFTGTKTNCFYSALAQRLYGPVTLGETWKQHFDNNSWDTIQDQIDAGYPFFLQPSEATGSYVKVFDFGAIFSNVVIAASYGANNIVGTVGIDISIETSTDNITYAAPVSGNTLFIASVRYARITFTLTPVSAGHDFCEIFNFTCSLNVKLENDGGNLVANSGDVGGTTVTLSKTFHSIRSITATVKQTVTRYIVIDFDYTTVDPTTFKVLVFNSSGARVTDTIGWQARGILVIGV